MRISSGYQLVRDVPRANAKRSHASLATCAIKSIGGGGRQFRAQELSLVKPAEPLPSRRVLAAQRPSAPLSLASSSSIDRGRPRKLSRTSSSSINGRRPPPGPPRGGPRAPRPSRRRQVHPPGPIEQSSPAPCHILIRTLLLCKSFLQFIAQLRLQ
jgi:hypothetical protein